MQLVSSEIIILLHSALKCPRPTSQSVSCSLYSYPVTAGHLPTQDPHHGSVLRAAAGPEAGNAQVGVTRRPDGGRSTGPGRLMDGVSCETLFLKIYTIVVTNANILVQ